MIYNVVLVSAVQQSESVIHMHISPLIYFLNFKKYLFFIYLFILAALSLSCGGLLSCDMWTLSHGMHAGSSSPTRGRTRAPCIGNVEYHPLDHQGSPPLFLRFYSHIGHYRVLSRVPCAIQQVSY